MGPVGKLNKREEFVVEWVIDDFLSLEIEDSAEYDSPSFDFANTSWHLVIYPNGMDQDETRGFIDLYLQRESSGPPVMMECTLGMKTVDGELDPERYMSHNFKKIEGYGAYKLLIRKELRGRKSTLLPSNALTVVCRMRHQKSSEFENDCSLCQDFGKMLLDGKNQDLTLKVRDKELRAHQDVLRVRSPVFESMLSHDMTEKESGVIDIPDCDPKAMELFLLYVYSGKVETLDPTNMLGLYYIADKYDMRGLKEKCCDFIKKSLSCTNICEVIQLALNHTDTSMLEYATEYFMENTVDILLTGEWQSFLKENTIVGNELLIKTFRKDKDSKKLNLKENELS